jgi:hypothetical protein
VSTEIILFAISSAQQMRGNRDLIGNQVGFAYLDLQGFVFSQDLGKGLRDHTLAGRQ